MGWFVLLCACSHECGADPNAPSLFDTEPEVELSDDSWSVGAHRVTQRVVREPTWRDNVYRRELRVWLSAGEDRTARWVELGHVRSERNIGIAETTPPAIVAGHLAVFVASTTFVVRPDAEVVRVDPYEVAGFEELTLNGHYDLRSRRLFIDGTRWRIELESILPGSSSGQQQQAALNEVPPPIVFESDDAGGTWRVASAPD